MEVIMELKGTETEKNLLTAFEGESQARNRYTYFSNVAKKEGYEQISRIFTETADNEKEHAELWFKALGGIHDTYSNLLDAACGENSEWTGMYREFSETARKEGFEDLARQFELVGLVEKLHEQRFLKLANNLKNNHVFHRDTEVVWVCLNCGTQIIGKDAPIVCPTCVHPQSYFCLNPKNY